MMLSARTQPKDDEEAVTQTTIEDLEPSLVRGLLGRLRRRSGGPFARMKDKEALRTLKALTLFETDQSVHWVAFWRSGIHSSFSRR
jgi:hypothetical protein